jgi:carboxylate-amine ligase
VFPAAEAADRLRAWAGVDVTLPELNGAQRQRRMIDAGATPFEVYSKCVEEAEATYSHETTV